MNLISKSFDLYLRINNNIQLLLLYISEIFEIILKVHFFPKFSFEKVLLKNKIINIFVILFFNL